MATRNRDNTPGAEEADGLKRITVTVELDEPIQRESGAVTRLTLRRPRAGEMRGLKVGDLLNGDIASVITLLPRIADPFVTEAETGTLSAADIAEIAGTVMGFFMTEKQMSEMKTILGISPSTP